MFAQHSNTNRFILSAPPDLLYKLHFVLLHLCEYNKNIRQNFIYVCLLDWREDTMLKFKSPLDISIHWERQLISLNNMRGGGRGTGIQGQTDFKLLSH